MMGQPTVFVVDDDASVCDALGLLLGTGSFAVETYTSAEAFLEAYRPNRPGCLVLDVRMPGMTGPELQALLLKRGIRLPIIFLTGHGDVATSVRVLKAGAVDFLEKPANGTELLQRVEAALQKDACARASEAARAKTRENFAHLTPREREVMMCVAAGKHNKDIARELKISHRTVEIHRARVMHKMSAGSVVELATMVESCGLGIGVPQLTL